MSPREDRAAERAALVERMRGHGIADERVLAAIGEVPRERFVPADAAALAYEDAPLAIGLGQTISAPLIVAFSAAALQAGPDAHVLEIGTGSGYGAAVLARSHGSVVTVERHGELADRARAALADAGCDNVEVRTGDGFLGAADRAPFDGIVVTAMAEAEPPPALLEQLAPGAALVCPVGHGGRGVLMRYRDRRAEELVEVAFVPLVPGSP
ncbi:protein-L-isoaspartate(D-aspartate) O-methyltransferase [Pseudonocardia kunmingensis]|uniref:Protein-L-isoaspartate O-methyltransferase n=1 Tax=Pseudonocardia kunmingensis TaxID=630975 RepID=A0A543D106_9PSEU|nr:protein-L-isoaspartate(D-aspartate) O-methyltransferase [Pseudonocardia kunmingensis]TQM03025.1 protein-L-isoaspartate(D-aspartate) O-methyltransferase [Pseudonocardia kunmingensis]